LLQKIHLTQTFKSENFHIVYFSNWFLNVVYWLGTLVQLSIYHGSEANGYITSKAKGNGKINF